MRAMLVLAVLLSGCNDMLAFTVPIPGTHGSFVIERTDLTECQMVHEQVHQKQTAIMGGTVMMTRVALEYAWYGKWCGPLEWEAYMAQWECEGVLRNPKWTQEALRLAMGCR